MSIGGWIVMSVSISLVLSLLGYCLSRVLFEDSTGG
ncbi:hypothetical protein Pla111_25990 [Botrimarina hoheduenensis]|uniref:Uncharacterized protein n=1 Tax=Botrimarina hoheduenensis TaxID=2528000 RepID=A0A5C5VYZ7_9BACT|nr:hypothetical protein Pla111_25990 [Botrimarina hoheduenensis]